MFAFFHECAHGLGSRLEGHRVSTGFDKIGDSGKRPSDHDFRLNSTVQGRWNLSDFLGPLVNWIFALIFMLIFLKQDTGNHSKLLFGAVAIINALIRLFPMLMFFASALQGRFALEDEATLGLSAIEGMKYPMLYPYFKSLASAQPKLLLTEPRIYFWPFVSLAISLACFLLTYRQLNKLSWQITASRFIHSIFILLPFLIWPPASIVVRILDNLIRLNW